MMGVWTQLKGGDDMYFARLWASEIIAGNRTYDEVPAGLKKKVKKILVEQGFEDLVTE